MVSQYKQQNACMTFVTMTFLEQLPDLSVQNYKTLYVVICRNQRLTVIHQLNMDHYRLTATGDFSECMEVYPDETPWAVPEIRR